MPVSSSPSQNNSNRELLEVIDRDGTVMFLAERSVVHGDPAMMHRVVHVLVFNSRGMLLLQKRSMKKSTEPGKWDSSVGGHVNPGEDVRDAAAREAAEELGITLSHPEPLQEYVHRDGRETELVTSFRTIHDGEFRFSRDEIDEIRFWEIHEIQSSLGTGIFTPHFESQFRRCLNLPSGNWE